MTWVLGIATILGGAAALWYFWEKLHIGLFHRPPKIHKLYPPKRLAAGTAIGVEGTGFSRHIEKNRVYFKQGSREWEAQRVTGGSTAPSRAMLTVAAPRDIATGEAMLTVSDPHGRVSHPYKLEITATPPAPELAGLGTVFAASAAQGPVGGRVAIHGFGFSPNANENIVLFEQSGRSVASRPIIVRGDALLGVQVPAGLRPGSANISLTVSINGRQIQTKDKLKYLVQDPPLIQTLDPPYGRPGCVIRVEGRNFEGSDPSHNLIVIRPYLSNEVLIEKMTVSTSTSLVFCIRRSTCWAHGLAAGPLDLSVSVRGGPESNRLVFDLQRAAPWRRRKR